MNSASIEPVLAYAESSLPVASLPDRLELLLREGLALEVANQGNVLVEAYRQAGVQISAVQAYRMHDVHPLHRDRHARQAAVTHVRETLELAAELGAPRIVTVCGFGHELADRPFDRAVDFFHQFADPAKKLGVRVAIEPLSPIRCGALTNPREIADLIDILGDPEVFSMLLDTGHLADSGIELNSFFRHWNRPIEELQLKGPRSQPPTPAMPISQWLKALPNPPAVVCVEHRQPISLGELAALLAALREELG